MDDRLVSLQDLADLPGSPSYSTLNKWANERRLEAYPVPGQRGLYSTPRLLKEAQLAPMLEADAREFAEVMRLRRKAERDALLETWAAQREAALAPPPDLPPTPKKTMLATVVLAVVIGCVIDTHWRVEWHPLGIDIDGFVAITVAVVVALLPFLLFFTSLGRRYQRAARAAWIESARRRGRAGTERHESRLGDPDEVDRPTRPARVTLAP